MTSPFVSCTITAHSHEKRYRPLEDRATESGAFVQAAPEALQKALRASPAERHRRWHEITNQGLIEPFRIAVPDAAMSDLRERLARTRWPDAGAGAWSDGTDLEYLQMLVDYWRVNFDWRRVQARMNELTQVRVTCGDVKIHAVHIRGDGPAPLPLVMTHGWPGSFFELLEAAKRLAHPTAYGADAADAFDVVIPSLPGFGFSDRPPGSGFEPRSIAQLWLELMSALGHERFGTQGGDWGSGVSTEVALAAPERTIGVHLNFMMRGYLPGPKQQIEFEPDEMAFFADTDRFSAEEGAYAHLHATKPQSVAYGLNDSPTGLAAWIVEKFRTWTDCGGDIERAVDRDDLLTNLSIYWFTQTIGSSMRIYRNRNLAPPSPPATPPDVEFRIRCISQGAVSAAATAHRACFPSRTLYSHAARWTLRSARTAGAFGNGRACVLRSLSMMLATTGFIDRPPGGVSVSLTERIARHGPRGAARHCLPGAYPRHRMRRPMPAL